LAKGRNYAAEKQTLISSLCNIFKLRL